MKLIAFLQQQKGLSRRTITAYIKENKIFVNDKVVESFGTQVEPGDIVMLDKQSITVKKNKTNNQKAEVILFHKPLGYVVSKNDPHNETIFQLLPEGRVHSHYPIGRLDKESSGLLLLSTDPKLVHELLHPTQAIDKIYEVVVKQERLPRFLEAVKKGCRVNEQGDAPFGEERSDLLKFKYIEHQRLETGHTKLTITLQEGKKRHIRRLLRFLGYTIMSLQRVQFGKRKLGELKSGEWKVAG